MAIKVTTPETKQEPKPFPKLMVNGNGCVRLVFKNCDSVILKSAAGENEVGRYSNHDRWVMEGFTDYNDPITIQNA